MSWVFLVLFIVFAVPIMWAYMQAKNKKPVNIKRKTLIISTFLSLVFLILYVVAPFFSPSNNTNSRETRTSQTQSSSKESSNSSSSEEESNDEDELSAKQIKKINKQLALDLEDDQNDADKGNDDYSWANYVLKITLNKDYQAKVWVDGGFTDLSEETKQLVAKKTNGLIGRSIVTVGIDYSPEQSREGIYMAFYKGSQAIGHSRFTDHTSIKWYK